MADKKITALTDIGATIASADLLHVVDDPAGNPINKKMTIANLFNNIPTWVGLDGTPQSIAAGSTSGDVNVTTSITQIATNGSNAHAGGMPDGSQGQIKIITMITDGGVNSVITPSNFANGSTMTFADVNDTVVLIFTNSKWVVLANTGVTIA